jgi:DNA-binding MarR family transcriptional regulator
MGRTGDQGREPQAQPVFLRILRLAEGLTQRMGKALEPFELTLTQYSALEALRHAGGNGLACGQIAQRLVNRDPDVTRLLDRLESRGLISRSRELPDRRVVRAQITKDGLQLVRAIDGAVGALHARHLAPIGRRNLSALRSLLEAVEALP